MSSLFVCNKCKQTFTRKQDFIRHKNRLTSCVNGSKTNKKLVVFSCEHCKKQFNRKDNMKRHAEGCSKKKKKIKVKNIDSTDIITTVGDNNLSFNKSPITINLVIYAKDGVKSLNYEELKKLLGSNENLVQGLIKIINLNPERPEHHNILYTDTKSSYGEVYENKTWIRKKIDEILEILIQAKIDDLNEILNDMKDFLNKKTRNKIKDTIENFDCSKPGARKKLKTYLKPILYNHKDMIIKTRKLTKKQEEEIFKKEQYEAEIEAKIEEEQFELSKKKLKENKKNTPKITKK